MRHIILTVLVFLVGLFFVPKANPANAQGVPIPGVTCNISAVVVYPGTSSQTTFPYIHYVGVPKDIPFSFVIICDKGGTFHAYIAEIPSSGPLITISPTYNGTGSGMYGPFGPLPVSPKTYRLVISAEISGLPADDITCNPWSCDFRVADTWPWELPDPPVDPPGTPPLGSLECPQSSGTFTDPRRYRYNPEPPVLNEAFQIQFNPVSGWSASSFYIQWTSETSSGQIRLSDASADGVWVANVPAQSTQFGWQLYGEPVSASTSVSCGISGVAFSGVGIDGGDGSSGKNPCLDTNGDGKVDTCPTGIGNIPTNLGDFATAVLRIALGISGGIVLILMVIGSIRVMTSSGDPKNVAAGRDMIVAALTGALFIAFSVMIMQFLGTAVVPIPGLVFGT